MLKTLGKKMPAKKKTTKAKKPSAVKKTVSKKTASKKSSGKTSNKNEWLSYYKQMLAIRRFEEKSGQLYGMGLIGGFCHLYIGQEAVVVGLQAALNETDTVITGYRDHGHMLVCGMDADRVMAELTGRIDGYSKGKGGSMHMFSREKGFYGGHGIVGAQVPLGTGLALAHQYKKDDGVTLAYFGDGASNQGQFFEAMNMAALWNLPIIYIIENNRYGMGTSVNRAAAGDELYKRGAPFGIKGERVDGMNVLKVKEVADRAVKYVRSGKGPLILEMMTYRYRGHSMSDPGRYRSKEEVQKVREKSDPILQLEADILKAKIATEADLKAIDKEIRAEMTKAADFAQESSLPEASELYTDVYSE